MKDIKEVLHLYLGSEFLLETESTWKNRRLLGFKPMAFSPWIAFFETSTPGIFYEVSLDRIKLIVKRLSDMSEEDAIELYDYCLPQFVDTVKPEIKIQVVKNDGNYILIHPNSK